MFGQFVRVFYEQTLIPPQPPFTPVRPLMPLIPLDADGLLKVGYSIVAFLFVALDWLDCRVTTEVHHRYRRWRRFLLDLLIAVVSYGALIRGAQGRIGVAAYIAIIYLLGVVWTHFCIQENPAPNLVIKFRITAFSHLVSALTFGLLFFLYRTQPAPALVPLVWLVVLFVVSLLIDDALHARFLPPENWVGPPGFPNARELFREYIGRR